MYFFMPSSFASCVPCWNDTVDKFFWRNPAKNTGSSRRSILVPTRMIGTLGQWWLTSGYHLARTLSYEAVLTTEKQIRKTSV